MGGANRPIAANRFGKPHSLGQFVDSGRPTTAFRLHHYFVQLAGLDQMSQRPVDITPAFDVFLERPFYISLGHFAPRSRTLLTISGHMSANSRGTTCLLYTSPSPRD